MQEEICSVVLRFPEVVFNGENDQELVLAIASGFLLALNQRISDRSGSRVLQ